MSLFTKGGLICCANIFGENSNTLPKSTMIFRRANFEREELFMCQNGHPMSTTRGRKNQLYGVFTFEQIPQYFLPPVPNFPQIWSRIRGNRDGTQAMSDKKCRTLIRRSPKVGSLTPWEYNTSKSTHLIMFHSGPPTVPQRIRNIMGKMRKIENSLLPNVIHKLGKRENANRENPGFSCRYCKTPFPMPNRMC